MRLALIITIIFFASLPAYADDDGKERHDKKWEELEKKQKNEEKESPLKEIMKLMDETERLFQQIQPDKNFNDQEKAVDNLLDKQDEVKKELDDLIKRIEESLKLSDSSSGPMGGDLSGAEGLGKKQRSKSKQRDKESKKSNYKNSKDNSDKDDVNTLESQKDKKGRLKDSIYGNIPNTSGASGRWGQLPQKLRDAINGSSNKAIPESHRKAIENYMKRLSKAKD